MELECLVNCEATALWRRGKETQYPEDQRNARAAEILTSLREQIAALDGSPIHERLVNLWMTKEGFGDIVSESLRSVGVHLTPRNGLELLEAIAEVAELADDLGEEEFA